MLRLLTLLLLIVAAATAGLWLWDRQGRPLWGPPDGLQHPVEPVATRPLPRPAPEPAAPEAPLAVTPHPPTGSEAAQQAEAVTELAIQSARDRTIARAEADRISDARDQLWMQARPLLRTSAPHTDALRVMVAESGLPQDEQLRLTELIDQIATAQQPALTATGTTPPETATPQPAPDRLPAAIRQLEEALR